MATFAEVTERLLQTINRPATELDILSEVQHSINDAVLILQRNHAYAYTESLASFVYPASALYVDLGTVCSGLVRDCISLQQLAAGGTYEGKPIKIKTYFRLQSGRNIRSRMGGIDETQIFSEVSPGITIEDSFRGDKIAFVMGRNIGIYPRLNVDTSFIIHIHTWLPVLVEDDDTNFFLTYAQDLVTMMALKRLHISMKTDSRFQVTQTEVDVAIAGLLAWDSQIKENPGYTTR